ncbi:MAG: ABC transporter permease [Candidatus Eremiobacteraeota bacterium]|nr:ABC transporter permease [Candidatus Eremiobacteraeota bacterium]
MNRLIAYFFEAGEAVWRNRTRSILTMLGMIIGTASVIAVLGISHAASTGISSQIASFGIAFGQVQVDQQQDDPSIATLQYRDVQTVADATPDAVREIEPLYDTNYPMVANRVHATYDVVSAGGYHTDRLTMRAGRRISNDDVAAGAHVATLTPDLADKFFKDGTAVGNFIDINGTRFMVVGVYDPVKASLFSGATSGTAEIPYTTYHRMQPGPISGMQFYPVDPAKVDQAGAAVVTALQRIHGARAKYQVQNVGAIAGGFDTVIGIIAVGLTAIGAVALLVAGIGIMNIMLVSVNERTREIGIRKSIGASRRDITLQFLMEALILALGGGGIGMLIGILATVGSASLISRTLGQAIVPYVLVVSVALGFSISVGLIFGMYPALRAAKMDPIEALRS